MKPPATAIDIARAVDAAVRAVDGVVDVAGERPTVATYGLGGRVAGIQVKPDGVPPTVVVHVTATLRRRLPETAAATQVAAVEVLDELFRSRSDRWRVDVRIADVALEADAPEVDSQLEAKGSAP